MNKSNIKHGTYRHYKINPLTGKEIYLGEVAYEYTENENAAERVRVRPMSECIIENLTKNRIAEEAFEELVDRALELDSAILANE